MPGWREEYLANIQEAELRNPVNRELVEAYSQLVDKVSALEAQNAALRAQSTSAPTASGKSANREQAPRESKTESVDPNSDDDTTMARLRLELTEALRARGKFQNRLQSVEDELAKLKTKTAAESKALKDLTAERRVLAIKLRDREEELRAKNKLVADVQDELAVLNMQLDITEKKRAEQKAENEQLVQRYMLRIGQEADAMNSANEPHFSKRRGE